MWKSKKFLNRALAKLTRFRPEELVGYVTCQEVLTLRRYFDIQLTRTSWPPQDYCERQKKTGNTHSTTAYFVVSREIAETFPLSKYYS